MVRNRMAPGLLNRNGDESQRTRQTNTKQVFMFILMSPFGRLSSARRNLGNDQSNKLMRMAF